MKKKLFSILLTIILIAQSNSGFAQIQQKFPTYSIDNEPKCFTSLAQTGVMSVSDFSELENLTSEILGSDISNPDEIKRIFRNNNCNPDTINEFKPARNSNFWLNSPFQSVEIKKDELNKACEVEQLLTDEEGCQPTRKLHQAIQNGDFTEKDYHSLKNSKMYQYSSWAAVATIGTLAISAYSAYLAKQAHDLEVQKYEDSKKATQETQQPCRPNESQKTSETKTEIKSEPKQEPTHDKPQEPRPQEPAIVTQTNPEPTKSAPGTKKPTDEVVDKDPNSNDADWENFANSVKKDNEKCDQKKQARARGVSLSDIENQQISHNRPNVDTSKNCNVLNLKRTLIIYKATKEQCFGNNAKCEKNIEQKEKTKQEEQRRTLEAYHNCIMMMGGSNQIEKGKCKELESYLKESNGMSFGESIEEAVKKMSEKPKSILDPKPTPKKTGVSL